MTGLANEKPSLPPCVEPGACGGHQTQHPTQHNTRGPLAIMMTEDLMTTNIRGERPNLSYRDRDVNISIHSTAASPCP